MWASTRLQLAETDESRLRATARDTQARVEAEFADRPWREARFDYLSAQRLAGRDEMLRLMRAVNVESPVSTVQVRQLLETAVRLYFELKPADASLFATDGELRLEVRDCPVYRRFVAERGAAACACFARRDGWYEALGKQMWDEQEANLAWGDPYCRVTIHPGPLYVGFGMHRQR